MACSPETLWLLDVSALESTNHEPGEPLEFSGRGFPPGREGEVSLLGVLRSPGQEPREVAWTLRTEARSEERVSVFMDQAATDAIHGHTSFSGSAVLRFAANERLSIAGRLAKVSIEWPGIDAGDASLRARAGHMLDAIGLAATESIGTKEVRVAQVSADSAAARAGLQVGEVIEHANEFPVRSFADLAQPSAAVSLELGLRDSNGIRRNVALRIPRPSGLAVDGLRYLLWACPAALALLFLGPWPTPLELLRASLPRVRTPRRSLFRVPNLPPTAQTRMDPVLIAASAAVCSVAAWLSPHLSLTTAIAVYAALLVLRRMDGPMWKGDGRELAIGNVFLTAALGCVAMLSGGAGLATLASDQGAAPWGWNVFSRPPVWLAVFIWVQCALRLHPATGCSHAHAWFDNLGRVLLAAMTAAVFLGGPIWVSWLPAWLELGVSSAVFALKTLAILWLMVVLQPLATARTRTVAASVFGLAALSALWLGLAPSREFELRLGCAVLVTLTLAVLAASFEHAWSKRRAIADSHPS